MTRTGTVADFPAIAAFDPFDGDRRAELIEGRCFVYEAGCQAVGYCSFRRVGFIGRPFVDYLAVAPCHRRHGIAGQLLAAVLAELGPGRIFISTGETNAPMRALLARHGWTPAGCVAGVNRDGTAECFFSRDV